MTNPVLFEQHADCLDVVLNRPDEGNLITNEMGQEIARALRELGPEIKLVRLRGKGANFCKGRQAPQIDRDTMTPLQVRHPVAEVPLALYGAIKECRAPTLAIVQGEAIGVGCALAAVCDLTIAAEDAVFQVPELEHNIAPTLVMWALINRASYKTAAHLVYTRERIGARAGGGARARHQGGRARRAGKRSRDAVAKASQPAGSAAAGRSRSI